MHSAISNRLMKSICLVACALAACTPTLNWRETRPADSAVSLLFPCKPDRFTRSLVLAGEKVQMALNSCAAGDVTYALSHAEFIDAARVSSAVQAMQAAAAGNLGGSAAVVSPLAVPGMTPNPLTQRWAVNGKRADGSAVQQQFSVFSGGLRVYQASVIGQTLDPVAADTFFSSLKLTP
jgi:cell division septation protein DedD